MKNWILSALLCCASIGASAADEPLIFAVNEGTTYRVSTAETKAKYDGVADDLSKLLRRRVQVEPVVDYAALTAGLTDKRFALAYVHPAQVSIRAVRSGSYHLLALTKGYVDYHATFFVPASSTLRTFADLKGKKVSAPEQDSITSWMVRATLRDALGADGASQVIYTRYQDAIPFMVEQGLADAGSSSAASVVKAWGDKGGRIIGTSKAVPIKHLLAASTLSPEQFKAVQDYFLNLEGGDAGRARLERMQVPGFVGFDESLLVGIGKWLGV
jgi:ABC-type phosphate/phosphonate transport system substrate-binding protein